MRMILCPPMWSIPSLVAAARIMICWIELYAASLSKLDDTEDIIRLIKPLIDNLYARLGIKACRSLFQHIWGNQDWQNGFALNFNWCSCKGMYNEVTIWHRYLYNSEFQNLDLCRFPNHRSVVHLANTCCHYYTIFLQNRLTHGGGE